MGESGPGGGAGVVELALQSGVAHWRRDQPVITQKAFGISHTVRWVSRSRSRRVRSPASTNVSSGTWLRRIVRLNPY